MGHKRKRDPSEIRRVIKADLLRRVEADRIKREAETAAAAGNDEAVSEATGESPALSADTPADYS